MSYRKQKYLSVALDAVKSVLYNYLSVSVPENIPQNKIVVLGKYNTMFEKVSKTTLFVVESIVARLLCHMFNYISNLKEEIDCSYT